VPLRIWKTSFRLVDDLQDWRVEAERLAVLTSLGKTGKRCKAMVKPFVSEEVLLDPEMRSAEVLDFERRLLGKIVGQDRAVQRIVNMYQIYLAGMNTPGRPIGNLLFLGPPVPVKPESLKHLPRFCSEVHGLSSKSIARNFSIAMKLQNSSLTPGYLGHRELLRC